MASLQNMWTTLHAHFVPSQKNAYRPHILHRSWLLFFLAIMLGVEGFLMTSLIGRQSNETFLAAVAGTTPMVNMQLSSASVSGVSVGAKAADSFQTFVRQVIRIMSDPRFANSIFGGIASLLFLAILFTFFIHIQIQPKDMLVSGVLVLMLALLCIYTNTHVFLNNGHTQTADAATSL
jgi:ABC-type polysaccharide/polyol phosphate export permease